MDKKITAQFIILTFCIMAATWGLCVVAGKFGVTVGEYSNHLWIYLPYMLGGWSPTIASYIVLKKNKKVSGLKQWLKNVFNVKNSAIQYLFVVFMISLFFGSQIIITGLKEMQPIYMLIAFLPVMLVGGGLEEAGWRYILQPELDKKYGFVLSSIITAIIWFAWHIPLFYIPGTNQHEALNLWMFAIGVLGLTFSFGAIRKVSGSVFLAVLAHSMTNAGWSTFIFPRTWLGTIVSTVLLVAVSTTVVFVNNHKMKSHT